MASADVGSQCPTRLYTFQNGDNLPDLRRDDPAAFIRRQDKKINALRHSYRELQKLYERRTIALEKEWAHYDYLIKNQTEEIKKLKLDLKESNDSNEKLTTRILSFQPPVWKFFALWLIGVVFGGLYIHYWP